MDTSAFVKYFHTETGSTSVISVIDEKSNHVYFSELTIIEFKCALYRRHRNNEINEQELDIVLSEFAHENLKFNIESLSSSVISEANNLLGKYAKTHYLRTLDSLHLATFNLISEKDWIFLSADDILNKVVQIMGYKVVNPLDI